jgi:cell division protein FtsI (penicillin-binding protein 3)
VTSRRDGTGAVPPRPRTDGGRSGIAGARAYSPRATTIREAAEQTRPARPAGEPRATDRRTPDRRTPDRATSDRRERESDRNAPEGRSERAVPGRKAAGRRAPERKAPERRAAERRTPERRTPERRTPERRTPERREDTPVANTGGRLPRQGAGEARRPAPRPVERRRAVQSRRPAAAPPRRRKSLRAGLGDPQRRLRLGMVVVMLLLSAVAGRLIQIQAVDAQAWAATATDQRMREVVLAAPRGAIVDRNGATLAHSVQARAVFADPKLIDDAAGTAATLAPLLGKPQADLERKIANKLNSDGNAIRFAYLARFLDPEVGQAVMDRKLPGIGLLDEERREVPGHDLAANVIGFTGTDGNGLAGVEARYDDVLAGKDGAHAYEVGGSGAQIPGGVDHTVPAAPGHDVQLTIDRDLQFEAQRILSARMRGVRGYTGTAVVLDARSGEALAMASYPSYDASRPGTSSEASRLDLATGAVIEPGSVHKAITIAAGLETGVVKPDSPIPVTPTVKKGGVTFRDTHDNGKRDMTLTGVLAQSSNTGTIAVADKVGAQRLYDFQRKFGLGRKTHVGLPGESAGIVQPPSNWSGPSYGGVPIGLGVAVTPLQMASAYQAIANDGVRVEPRVVKGTVGDDGALHPGTAPERTRVMSSANAAALRQMLEAVPTAEGTAPLAAIPGYRVAGKTGTGQRVLDNRYLPGNVASFVGMAPADAPRFVIAVFVHAPAGVGGAVAGPSFRDLMSFALRHFAVPPTGAKAPAIRLFG